MLRPETLEIRPRKIIEARRAISKLLSVLGTQDINEALVLIRNEDGGYIMPCDIPILRKTQVEMGNPHVKEVIQKAINEFNGAYKVPVELMVEESYGEVVADHFIEKGYRAISKESTGCDIVKIDIKGKDSGDECPYL